MHHRWTLTEPDNASVYGLSQAINVSVPIAKALVNRGINTFEEAKLFFRPSLENCYSPFLMTGMKEAATRLCDAIETGEQIMIYGDYDVDGTTGTSILYLYLKETGAKVSYYINDRHSEGYGVAISGLEEACKRGATIVISVDCGITAIEPAKFCKSKAVDFIVCDHHEPVKDEAGAELLPDAFAILNPKQKSCGYPFKELCGCGVAFKLMQGISEMRKLEGSIAAAYLDLVAVAIAADIVKMNSENRILMAEGLKRINGHQDGNKHRAAGNGGNDENSIARLGLRAMATECGLDLQTASSERIVFTVAPRINAAGRLGDAKRAIDLFTATSEAEATTAAKILEAENLERRAIDRENFIEAEKIAASQLASRGRSSLVLYKPDWHQGVIGIVASRIVEKFYLPTVIFTDSGDNLKGSVRSVFGLNVHAALTMCKDLIVQFGGHAYAAGLTIEPKNLEVFREAFDAACAAQLTEDLRVPALKIDAELELEHLTPNFLSVMRQFAPFGPENWRPLFLTKGISMAFKPKLLKDQHLKFAVRKPDGELIDAIGFNMLQHFKALENGKAKVSLVYSVEENEWNGKTSLQLKLRDLKVDEN